MTPSLGLINLLCGSQNSGKTVHLLEGDWFIIKRYKSGTAKWHDAQGKTQGGGEWSVHACPRHVTLPGLPHAHPPRNSQTLYFRDFYGGFIT